MKKKSAEEYLLSIPLWTKKKNSFEDIRMFLKELGCGQQEYSIIHVAGTNGKGSVCAFLTSVLGKAGFHTGTFTSPHLVDIRERIMLDGVMISEELFDAAFQKVLAVTEKMTKASFCHPSFFEFLFLMSMVVFKDSQIEYAIIETGLGGRLDTTNVLEHPSVSVITSISMDHMEYLGDTIEKIASEKSGIIKAGIPVVYDGNCKEAAAVITKTAKSLNSQAFPVLSQELKSEMTGDGCQTVTLQEDGQEHKYTVPFIAGYQAVNAALAVRTIRVLQLPVKQTLLEEGIRTTRWAGRMEEVLPGVYLDGAHNVGGIEAFIETAGRIARSTDKELYLFFAAVSDKEYGKMIEQLCREISWTGIITAHIDNKRSLDGTALKDTFLTYASCPVSDFAQDEDALQYMLKLRTGNEIVFCAGSLYLIGEIKSALRRIRHD